VEKEVLDWARGLGMLKGRSEVLEFTVTPNMTVKECTVEYRRICNLVIEKIKTYGPVEIHKAFTPKSTKATKTAVPTIVVVPSPTPTGIGTRIRAWFSKWF
jgi:hypothetical protein